MADTIENPDEEIPDEVKISESSYLPCSNCGRTTSTILMASHLAKCLLTVSPDKTVRTSSHVLNLTPDFSDLPASSNPPLSPPQSPEVEEVPSPVTVELKEPEITTKPDGNFVPLTTREHGACMIRQAARISAHLRRSVTMQEQVLKSAVSAEEQWIATFPSINRELNS